MTPSLLLGRDIDAMRTKAGIERAVVDVLRRLGFLPPQPKGAPKLHVVNCMGPVTFTIANRPWGPPSEQRGGGHPGGRQ